MPKLPSARVPENTEEERRIRKPAGSRHAPDDWIFRALIISLSWRGLRSAKIAEEIGCHPKTVRKRLHRFNAKGLDGLGGRLEAGRKPRITEDERSRIIALVQRPAGQAAHRARRRTPGRRRDGGCLLNVGHARRERARDGRRGRAQPGAAHPIARARPLAQHPAMGRERRSGVCPKRSRIVELYTNPPPNSTVVCMDELGPFTPRAFPPAPGWSPDGHHIKAPLEYSRGPDKA